MVFRCFGVMKIDCQCGEPFYCTQSCLTMMAGVGVAHKLLKKKHKKMITIQIFDKAISVKTIYKQSSGTGIPSHVPAQPSRSLYFGLVSAETVSVVSPFQVAIVLGKKENFSPSYMHSEGDTERGGIWYSCYLYQPFLSIVCVCVFGFNVAFNIFSVISRRCSFASGS